MQFLYGDLLNFQNASVECIRQTNEAGVAERQQLNQVIMKYHLFFCCAKRTSYVKNFPLVRCLSQGLHYSVNSSQLLDLIYTLRALTTSLIFLQLRKRPIKSSYFYCIIRGDDFQRQSYKLKMRFVVETHKIYSSKIISGL